MEKQSVNILIVDDDRFMLSLLRVMLENMGYTNIMTAQSGVEALEYISGSGKPPDLILCDLRMPGMDGLEFARNLVTFRYSGNLIIVSGAESRILESAEKLLQAHGIRVLGQLRKPFIAADLAALIEKWTPPPNDMPIINRKMYSREEIQKAIINQEFLNYYQPKTEVATGRVTGMETLVRWQHPSDGLVFPEQFIAVAEKNGIIDDITAMIFSNALAAAGDWHDNGQSMKIAVNISMSNLRSLYFPDFIEQLANDAGVPPENIILEITESQLMENHLVSIEVLTRLRLKGFALSIDDFGTGNSTFAQLRDIPFSELKVDRGFVHGACCANTTIRAIYHASLDLAKKLNMAVVAEGVEDIDDWDFLKHTGCQMAQGYFLAHPMPESSVSDWVESWHQRIRDGEI